MLASLQPARCNAYVFNDALSNDILLSGYSTTQHILLGFGSNNQSTLTLSKSNLSIPSGGFYASNIAIGLTTPTPDFRLHVAGSAKIEGDLVVNGDMTYLNTDVQVTDQFTVSNAGTGPALVVIQTGAQSIAEFRDDDNVVMKIVDGGFVTIGSNNPTTKLDVEGDTTVRGTIYTSNVITSNVETMSFTSTISTNLTTVTSNLYSSNLIINNQTIIDSNGIITNSNFLPPLNTSNIVAGQFTSNFIRDDELISSKLASNLILKGTTTISSNAFISNGDLKILGSNNFISTGHQARLFLGSNDYFMGASKNVGLVLQVPGTVYPVILENNSGFLGLGTMDPEENLHVRSNAKIEGSQFVMSQLGIGTSNPLADLDVKGQVRITYAGPIAASFTISNDNSPYIDIVGSNSALTLGASGNNGHHSTDANIGDVVIKNSQVLPTGRFFLQTGNGASAIAINSNNSVGIGLSTPTFKLHVNGDIYAMSNIRSSVGTLGPAFSLVPENAYADVTPGNVFLLNKTLEAGNPASHESQPLFYGNSYLYQDASEENMAWNFARLIFRGCPLSTPASTSSFTIQDYVNGRTPTYSNLTSSFTLSNDGSQYGYVTYATPWFPASGESARSIALNYISNSESVNFRIGQVQIQFKT